MQQQEVTRAETPLETFTQSFRVWAYKNMEESVGDYSGTQTVMEEYTVDWISGTAYTTTTNTDGWEYILQGHPDQSIKYWDFDAEAYRFFGIAEMSSIHGTWDKTTDPDAYKYTCSLDASIDQDAPFYSKLWFSDNTGSEKLYGQPVKLEFTKPFAEVRFFFTYSDPTATPKPMLEDPDFRPVTADEHIATVGTVTIIFPIQGTETTESWESAPDYSTKYLLSFTTPWKEATSTIPEGPWYKVLPIASQGAYILKVTVNGADKTCTVPAQYMTWGPGYRYTYIFKVNDEGGVELDEVHVGVKNWENGGEKDHIIFNW